MRIYKPSSGLPAPEIARHDRGFTILELLTVVAILAAVAGVGILAMVGVREDTGVQVGRTEISHVKEAILQFQRDTGFLPKQGPFAVHPDDGGPGGGGIRLATLPVWVTANQIEWFNSPANFWQLYVRPDIDAGHAFEGLENWDPVTRRGWRGPYLSQLGEGLVDVGSDLLPTGEGSPIVGPNALREMYSVRDPFVREPFPVDATIDPDGNLLDYRSQTGGAIHPRSGRPYFVFHLNDQGTATPALTARIVSPGPDGVYDCERDGVAGCTAADVNGDVNNFGFDLCVAPPGSDDIINCLLR